MGVIGTILDKLAWKEWITSGDRPVRAERPPPPEPFRNVDAQGRDPQEAAEHAYRLYLQSLVNMGEGVEPERAAWIKDGRIVGHGPDELAAIKRASEPPPPQQPPKQPQAERSETPHRWAWQRAAERVGVSPEPAATPARNGREPSR